MNWAQFRKAAPKLAHKAEELFDQTGVVLLGTVRKNGSPRISPVESLIADGELYLGGMPKSLKMRDLLRDPRCTVHSIVRDRWAHDGEFKLHGQARHVLDPKERKRFGAAVKKKIGMNPEEMGMSYHLFAINVASAAFFWNEKSGRRLWLWRAHDRMKKYAQNIEGELTPEK